MISLGNGNGFHELFELMVEKGASDLHIRVPSPPVLRVDGALTLMRDLPPITEKDVENLLEHVVTPEQMNTFIAELELDFSYSVPGLARFRGNALRQRGTTSLCRIFATSERPKNVLERHER